MTDSQKIVAIFPKRNWAKYVGNISIKLATHLRQDKLGCKAKIAIFLTNFFADVKLEWSLMKSQKYLLALVVFLSS